MRLYLIAATSFLHEGVEAFLGTRNLSWRETPTATDSERLVEFAGRICYLSFSDLQSNRSNPEYIANLVRQGHESVLEHGSFTVLADGISRALTHQVVRHRVGFSYSQLSQQYHDEGSAEFVMPPELRKSKEASESWRDATNATLRAYKRITELMSSSDFGRELSPKERLRAIRSIARSVLPNASVTALVITGNARAWRYVLALRGGIEGDPEMRRYCVEALRLLKPHAPAMFEGYEILTDEIGEYIAASK